MTLRQYRTAHSLTLASLAVLLGKKLSTVHGWETGRRAPSLADAMAVQSKTAGMVAVADLLPGSGAA